MSVTIDTTYDEVIQAGADLLDREGPERWWEAINLDDLTMVSAFGCVLGQLYGDYAIGREELGIVDGATYGFSLASRNGEWRDWAVLTRAWRDYLEERRRAEHPDV